LFQFSKGGRLGVHLGMTGELRIEPADFRPGKHDHLVLRQRSRSLVFSDARLFGRVLFHLGKAEPEWWTKIPPALTSDAFTIASLKSFLSRRARAPIKGVLLMQERFPGVGNWMADEILWRAKIHPGLPSGRIADAQAKLLWQTIRWVCRGALRIVAKDYSDPPPSWLFPHRWEKGGRCPKDGSELARATIGGRTTAWCPKCQPRKSRRIQPSIQ
jgi:formamidopyrimidine-DNA glycosylase